jgi:hypothetical protein
VTAYNHNGFRDYYPVYGRYLESDPIGLAGGLNPYAYAGNNPSKNIDPNGLATLQIGFAGSASIPFGPSLPFGIGIAVDSHFHTGLYGYGGLRCVSTYLSRLLRSVSLSFVLLNCGCND